MIGLSSADLPFASMLPLGLIADFAGGVSPCPFRKFVLRLIVNGDLGLELGWFTFREQRS